MSKKFSSKDIEFILDRINSWEGDITWVGICDSLEEHFGKKTITTSSFKTYRYKICI